MDGMTRADIRIAITDDEMITTWCCGPVFWEEHTKVPNVPVDCATYIHMLEKYGRR